jgi:hypothetical protein
MSTDAEELKTRLKKLNARAKPAKKNLHDLSQEVLFTGGSVGLTRSQSDKASSQLEAPVIEPRRFFIPASARSNSANG